MKEKSAMYSLLAITPIQQYLAIPDGCALAVSIVTKDTIRNDIIFLYNSAYNDDGCRLETEDHLVKITIQNLPMPQIQETTKCICPSDAPFHNKFCPYYAPSPQEIYRGLFT